MSLEDFRKLGGTISPSQLYKSPVNGVGRPPDIVGYLQQHWFWGDRSIELRDHLRKHPDLVLSGPYYLGEVPVIPLRVAVGSIANEDSRGIGFATPLLRLIEFSFPEDKKVFVVAFESVAAKRLKVGQELYIIVTPMETAYGEDAVLAMARDFNPEQVGLFMIPEE
jgi:hypothetical protein